LLDSTLTLVDSPCWRPFAACARKVGTGTPVRIPNHYRIRGSDRSDLEFQFALFSRIDGGTMFFEVEQKRNVRSASRARLLNCELRENRPRKTILLCAREFVVGCVEVAETSGASAQASQSTIHTVHCDRQLICDRRRTSKTACLTAPYDQCGVRANGPARLAGPTFTTELCRTSRLLANRSGPKYS